MSDALTTTHRRKLRVRLNDDPPTRQVERNNGREASKIITRPALIIPDKSPRHTITPQELAYALPGGLAKLAYPKWIYAPYIKYVENRILPIVEGEKSIYIMFS